MGAAIEALCCFSLPVCAWRGLHNCSLDRRGRIIPSSEDFKMDIGKRKLGCGSYCAVRGCTNSWKRLNVWLEGECYDHRPATRRRCGCAPPFALFLKPTADNESRMWLAALKLKKPPKRVYVCSYHFVDKKPTEENPFPELFLGYERPPQRKRRKLERNPGFHRASSSHGMSHSAPHSPQSAGPEPTSPGPGPDPGPSPDSTKVLEKPRLSGSSEAPADNTESSPEDLLGLVLCDSCIDTPLPAVKSCLTCLVSFCSSHLRPHLENPKFCSHRLLDPLQDVERRTCEIHHQSLDWFCVPDQECICEGCVEEAHRGHERRSVEEARRSVERELKQKEGEMAKTVTAAEAAINKLQQNMVSIESSVSDVCSVVDSQLDVLSAFVEQTKRSLMDLLEAEEKQALNQAHGIQVHLENRLLDLRKTQVQVQRISRTKNSLDFLQEYCEWRQQALDTSLPSVCIELKDTSKFFAKIITESTEKLCVAMTTEFTDRLHKACTHEPALGIKTTVQKINAAQRNKRLPDPQTRKDLLKYGKQLSFDGTSSHKFLRLTEEGRKVTNTTPWQHPYPDHDLRFDHWRQVLCTESVYLDRVYYELDFNGDGTHLGLAYKSLPRKGAEAEGCLCSNNGSWCLQWTGKSFSAWHDDEEVILPVTPGPRFSRMGVYVDHTGGLLRFYGLRPSPVDDDAQICLVHEFTAQFREPLYPAFFLPKKENAVMLVPPGEPVKSPTPPTSSNNNENANNNNGNANNNNEKTTSPLNGDSKTVTSETAQNVNAKNAKSEVAEEAKANSDGNANKWNANPTENRDSNTPTKETAPNANANNSSNAKSDIADIG